MKNSMVIYIFACLFSITTLSRGSAEQETNFGNQIEQSVNAMPTSDPLMARTPGYRFTIGARAIISTKNLINKMVDNLYYFPNEEEIIFLSIVYSAGKRIERSPDNALGAAHNNNLGVRLIENKFVLWNKDNSQFLGFSDKAGTLVRLDWSSVQGAVTDLKGLKCPELPMQQIFENTRSNHSANGIEWYIWELVQRVVHGRMGSTNTYNSGGSPKEPQARVWKNWRDVVYLGCQYEISFTTVHGTPRTEDAVITSMLYEKSN